MEQQLCYMEARLGSLGLGPRLHVWSWAGLGPP